MANLKARIEGYVGSLVSTDIEVEDVLSAERSLLIRLLPDDLLTGNATVATVADGVFSRTDIGTDSDYRVLSVFNETSDMYARLGESHSKYGNNQSIYFADSNSPVYVVDYGTNRETRIFPAADSYKIRYLTFGGDVDISSTTVDGFDRRTLQLFVLKGCAFELSNRIQVDIADLAAAFYNASGLTLPTSPIANLPAAPLLTFNAVTPTSVVATSISAVTPPTPPSSPTFTYTDAVASTISGINISSITSLANSLATPSAPSFTFSAVTPTSVLATTIATVTAPTPPSSPTFTYTDAVASTVFGINISSITSLANTLAVPGAPIFTYTDVVSDTYTEADAALNEVDTIIQDLASSSITLPILSVSYADFNTAMTNGDIELAQSYLSQIQTELSEYQAESQTAINEFTALNARRYDSSINHAVNKVDAYLKRLQDIASRADSVSLQNEAKQLEKQVSTYRLSLDRYTQDLNKYQADVQKLVQATQIELEQLRANAQLETDVNVQNEARSLEAQISEYQAALSLYQSELNEHQIEVQKAVSQAQLTQERLIETAQRTDNISIQDEARQLEKEVAEYRADLDLYGQDLNKYQLDIQKLVQATQIQLEQLRANAQFETDVSIQNEARALEAQISEYQSSLSLYQAELTEHQVEVQKAISQAQLTQERLVETAQRTDNLAVQDEARRLEKEVSEYRLELERFGTEIQTYGQELQSYGLQLQSKVSEANDKMQRKTLEIQSLNADRQYYDAMYAQELQKLGVVQANG